MSPKAFTADLLFTGGKFQSDKVLIVDDQGTIAEVTDKIPEDIHPSEINRLQGRAILPGAVNSHSHAFQILIRGQADKAADFRDWVDNYLYPLVLDVDEKQLYAGALLAFAEMALNGATTVGEFYYIHNEKDSFECKGTRLSEIAIRAAKDVGLRICLLRTLYDSKKKEGQKRFYESPDHAAHHTEELYEKFKSDPFVTVLPAPHSLHGASEEGIQKGAEVAEKWDAKFHIHLAEELHDLKFSQEKYGTTPLRALEKIGVLNDRLVIVHGCHLDKEEIAMLGEAGGGLAYNPVSNMALGDGISNIDEYIRQGVTVSLGADGPCANNQVDIFSEMKATEHLQRVSQLKMGVVPAAARNRAETSNYLFEMGTVNGGKNLCLPLGKLEAGQRADFIALDLNDLSLLPDFGLDSEVLLNNIVYSMSIRSALTDSVVGGQFIVRDRRLVRVSRQNVVRKVREALRK